MKNIKSKHYLLEASLLHDNITTENKYPFSIPAIKKFKNIVFHPAVTFLIGENGVGKSTLLEALSVTWGLNPEGGSSNFQFSTRNSHSELTNHIKLIKGAQRPKDSYFLRAESFFNVATEIEKLDEEPGGPPIINSYGGNSLHEQSHGESFFALLLHRFMGQGLYILDEPEAALSPLRQMAMISRLHELVKLHSQFIIATHSPIILAYPNSKILLVNEDGIQAIKYTDTEHFIVTKDFLNNHEKSIYNLINE